MDSSDLNFKEQFLSAHTKKDKVLRTIGIIAAVITLVSSIIYLYFGKLIPGLSPLTLAVVMAICARSIHQRKGRKSDHYELFLELIFLFACLLNVIAGICQIVVYLKRH